MSLQEFITSLRAGSRFFGTPEVSSDSPALDPRAMQSTLANAAIWLTPRSVAGYDDSDFAFMDPHERDELRQAVQGFLDVARQVPSDAPATRDQLEAGRRWFSTILKIIRPDLHPDADTLRLSKLRDWYMSWPGKPEPVVDMQFHVGQDSTGEPAAWVWLILADKVAESSQFFDMTEAIRQQFVKLLPLWGVTSWPYVRFRTASELDGEGADHDRFRRLSSQRCDSERNQAEAGRGDWKAPGCRELATVAPSLSWDDPNHA